MSKRAAPQARGKPRSQGIQSNKLKEVGYRGGKRTVDVISPEAVSELGMRTAFKKPPLVKSTPNDFVPMGNTMNKPCGSQGEGRTVYKTGFQSLTGPVAKGEGESAKDKADRGPRAILGEPGSKV
jgi:hypothetical protein